MIINQKMEILYYDYQVNGKVMIRNKEAYK